MQNALNPTSAVKVGPAGRQAFTLIEMMLVVALIGILIGGMFRLINAVGQNTQRAETINRLQRLENAISGFYAEYGTYPPVLRVYSPDPYVEQDESTMQTSSATELTSANACRAAHSQPVAFEFPSKKALDGYIMTRYGAYSANQNASDPKVKRFQYCLLSFLLPRIQTMGGSHLAEMKDGEDDTPDLAIFAQDQWTKYNSAKKGNKQSFMDQNSQEVALCSRWLPHLEGMIYGGIMTLGVKLQDSRFDFVSLSRPYESGSGNIVRLARNTIFDGWTKDPEAESQRELYYYSEPPYQSYRLWSAGPDGKTFPPWIPLETLSSKDRKTVSGWIEDDIVRFDSK